MGVQAVSGLVGSVLVLLTLNYVRYSKGPGRLLIPGVVAAFYAPIIVSSQPYTLALATVGIVLLAGSMAWRRMSIVLGGGLVGFHGSLLYAARGLDTTLGVLYSLLPAVYSLASTSHASLRVVGLRRLDLALWTAMMAALAGYSLLLYTDSHRLASILLLTDTLIRILETITRANYKLGIKQFGIIEFARNLVVMSLIGIQIA